MALGMLLIMLQPCEIAASENIQIGGDDQRIRIVFFMQKPSTPDIVREDQTLIVNFPDIIGTPQALQDFHFMEDFSFDGSVARIRLKTPYLYKTTVQSNPSRLTLDITTTRAPVGLCPIVSLDAAPRTDGIAVTLHVKEAQWPRILYARSKGRVYLIFDGAQNCEELQARIASVPFINYGGTLKMQDGTAVVLALSEAAKDLTIQERKPQQQIILTISTRETIDLPKLVTIAGEAYAKDDIAATIDILKPHRAKLPPEASVLLANAWWRIAYPYDATLVKDAVALMGQGVAGMNPGLERERAMLTYAAMLLATNTLDEARKYIRFLKDSQADEIAIAARILEMDLLNRQAQYDDAFAASKRLLNTFPEGVIPADQKGRYDVALGDTYLGLNDYPKALEQYTRGIAADPALFRKDLSLYARMGDAAFKMNDFAKARFYILQSVNLGDPRTKTTQMIRLGDCLYQLGEVPKAVEIYSQVGNLALQGESTVIAKLRKAGILIDNDLKDDGKLSKKTFYEVLGIYDGIVISPNSPEHSLAPIVKIRRAQLYGHHGDWNQAFEIYYQTWRETKVEDPLHKYAYTEAVTSLNAYLRALSAQKDPETILAVYTKYRESFLKKVTDPEAMLALAQAFAELNQPQSAHPLLTSCIRIPSPVREAALSALFDVDCRLGYFNEAFYCNTLYLTEYPQGAAAGRMRDLRGMVLYRLNRFPEAIPFLESVARSQEAKAIDALAMLVDIHHRNRNRAGEDAALDRLVALNQLFRSPTIAWAMYIRAGQLLSTDTTRSKALFESFLNAYPQSSYRWGARYSMAAILARQGKTDEAFAMYNHIVQHADNALLVKAARAHLVEMDLKDAVAGVKPTAVQAVAETVPDPTPAPPQPALTTPPVVAETERTAPVKTRPARRDPQNRAQTAPVTPARPTPPAPSASGPVAQPTPGKATRPAVPRIAAPIMEQTPLSAVKPAEAPTPPAVKTPTTAPVEKTPAPEVNPPVTSGFPPAQANPQQTQPGGVVE